MSARRKRPTSSASSASGRRRPGTANSPYSESWMGAFVARALKSLDLVAECAAEEISLADLSDYRSRDPAFNRAMDELDRSLDLAIGQQLRARAAAGDSRATSLLLRRRAELAALSAGPDGPVEPRLAEVMIAAALLASGEAHPDRCPVCHRPMEAQP